MKRIFWFGLGMAAGIAAARKARGTVRRLTPAGAAENVGDAIRELALAVGSFGADVRAGMVEREAELRATVIERTGIDTTPHYDTEPRHLAQTGPGWLLPPQRESPRARRSGRTASRA